MKFVLVLLGVLLLKCRNSRGDPYFRNEFNKCMGVCPFYNDVKEVDRVKSCLKVSEVQGDEARKALELPKDLKGLATFAQGLNNVPRVKKECKIVLELAQAILKNATKENDDKNNCLLELFSEKEKVLHYSNSSQFWEEKAEKGQVVLKQLFDGLDQILEVPTGILNLSFAERGATMTRSVKELKNGFDKLERDFNTEQELRNRYEGLVGMFNSSAVGLREELDAVKTNMSSNNAFLLERIEVIQKNASTTLSELQNSTRDLNMTTVERDECFKEKKELKEVVDQQREELKEYDKTDKNKDLRIAKAENASLALNVSLTEALASIDSKTQEVARLKAARDEARENATKEKEFKELCENASSVLAMKVEEGEKCEVDKGILKNERDNLVGFKKQLESRVQECYDEIPKRDQKIANLTTKLNTSESTIDELQDQVLEWQGEASQMNVSLQEAFETIRSLNESLKREHNEKTKVQNVVNALAENATSSTHKILALNETNGSQQEKIAELTTNITEGIESFLGEIQALNETNGNLATELDNKNATLVREARSLVNCKQRRDKLDRRVGELRDFEDKYEKANDQLDAEIANRKDRGVSDKTLKNGTAWRYLTSNMLTLLAWIGCMVGCFILGVITALCCTSCRCKIRRGGKSKLNFLKNTEAMHELH